MSLPRVFLSCASADQDAAASVAAILREGDFDVWEPSTSVYPGDDWAVQHGRAPRDADVVVVLVPWAESPGPDEFVEVDRGVLPAYLPGTSLHGGGPARWELLVAGRTRWGRVMETFLVPVYAVPGGAAAAASA